MNLRIRVQCILDSSRWAHVHGIKNVIPPMGHRWLQRGCIMRLPPRLRSYYLLWSKCNWTTQSHEHARKAMVCLLESFDSKKGQIDTFANIVYKQTNVICISRFSNLLCNETHFPLTNCRGRPLYFFFGDSVHLDHLLYASKQGMDWITFRMQRNTNSSHNSKDQNRNL